MDHKPWSVAAEKAKCCTCGYEWVKGLCGGHSCSDVLLKRIAELEADRTDLISSCKEVYGFMTDKIREDELLGIINRLYHTISKVTK